MASTADRTAHAGAALLTASVALIIVAAAMNVIGTNTAEGFVAAANTLGIFGTATAALGMALIWAAIALGATAAHKGQDRI